MDPRKRIRLMIGMIAFAVTVTAASGADDVKLSIQKGINYLITKQDPKTGGYGLVLTQPATTALVEVSFLDSPLPYMGPFIVNGFSFLEKFAQQKGGMFASGKGKFSYNTAWCLLAMLAKKDDAFKDRIAGAKKYLINMQFTEDDGPITKDYTVYGGWGYDHKTLAPNPDIITTFLCVWALERAGEKNDSDVFKRAIVFASRCQDKESGGFLTAPGFSVVTSSRRTLRGPVTVYEPYGSATCAGVATLLLSGVSADDASVQSGLKWLGENYTLRMDPNKGYESTYQYYFLFAKALKASGVKKLVVSGKKEISWADVLAKHLISEQRSDGSWVNEPAVKRARREWVPEAEPVLTTAYAVLALSICNEVLGK